MKPRTLITGVAAVAAAGALTVTGTLAAQAQETGAAALGEAIDQILADDRITQSQAGVLVRDAATGEVVYDRNGDQRAIPASNNKLATVAAALGVSSIGGDLVADDTAFDSVRHGDEWAWGDLQYAYAMEVSALTVGSGDDHLAGSVRFYVDPGAAEGDDVAVTTVPETGYVTIVNEATTGAPGSGDEISIDRDEHANTVYITGTLGTDAGQTYGTRSVIDPAGLAADVFANALAANGIDFTGDVRTGESVPQGPETLASHESAPLSHLSAELLKPSNNAYAESFFKALGAATAGEGSFGAGQEAVAAALTEYGVDTAPVRQVDGSGLSRWDEVTPETVTDLLIAARDASWYDAWYAALPVACEPDPEISGTLDGRMCDTPAAGNVHAKTGTLTSVSALSGYATDADGRELVFSIVFNDHLADSVKDVEDRIAAAIAGHGQDADAEEIARTANLDELADPDHVVPGGQECTWYEPVLAC
jgi:D-alanyl-D-alanine carboxypeptidase/D-alanyl-D-alanine-endopeptidase (penicillin-binding protein 4)